MRQTFGFAVDLATLSFHALRTENSVIEHFFDRRETDPQGGEGGERIQQVKSRPVYSLHSGRTRGATWLDRSRPPQNIVWLLGAELHDERHKGRSDAYDIFAALEETSELFPASADYKLLELDRRRLDTTSFADDVRRDAKALVEQAASNGAAEGLLAGVPSRVRWEDTEEVAALYVAISTKPIRGPRSGLMFPLSQRRFLLLSEAVRQAAEERFKPEVLCDTLHGFPGGLRTDERAFLLMFEAHE